MFRLRKEKWMYCNVWQMVLMMLGSGLRLCISRHTVSRHLRNLCKKCNARNSVQLIFMFSGIEAMLFHQQLTPRENEVINLLAKGLTQKTIAAFLGISFATVCKHRENILLKLDVHSIREAVAKLCKIQMSAE